MDNSLDATHGTSIDFGLDQPCPRFRDFFRLFFKN